MKNTHKRSNEYLSTNQVHLETENLEFLLENSLETFKNCKSWNGKNDKKFAMLSINSAILEPFLPTFSAVFTIFQAWKKQCSTVLNIIKERMVNWKTLTNQLSTNHINQHKDISMKAFRTINNNIKC